MPKYILYDIEIIKAIPDKSPIPVIKYCGGWNDHGNMGVSVIGFCEVLTGDDDPFAVLDTRDPLSSFAVSKPDYLIGDEFGLAAFAKLASDADGVIGFNSRNFDDRVMLAMGFLVACFFMSKAETPLPVSL